MSIVYDAKHGYCEVESDQSISYTVLPEFHGQDNCVYSVTDSNGASDSAVLSVVVTPSPLAKDQVFVETSAENDAATMLVDTGTIYANVLENDFGDGLELSEIAFDALHGTCEKSNDKQVSYTPEEGFTGQDVCVYLVCSSQGGGCDSAVLTVNVKLDDIMTVDRPDPSAVNDDAVVTANSGVNMIDVLANDVDPSGNELFVGAILYGKFVLHSVDTPSEPPLSTLVLHRRFTRSLRGSQRRRGCCLRARCRLYWIRHVRLLRMQCGW